MRPNKPTHKPKLAKEYTSCQHATDRQQKGQRIAAADNSTFEKYQNTQLNQRKNSNALKKGRTK